MDYDQYLLSSLVEVSADDVLCVIKNKLVPIFDSKSKLSIACPSNKLDPVYDYFTKRGWTNLMKVPEEKLFSAFLDDGEGNTDHAQVISAEKTPGMSMFLPGAFAAQFRCACPRCDR